MPPKRPMIDVTCLAIFGITLLCPTVAGIAQETSIEYENAKQGVKYIGTQQCVSCHSEQHASYLETTHSVATAKTDSRNAPAPTMHKHPMLDVLYEVEQQDGRLVHRETVRDFNGAAIATTQKSIEFSVGSGAHAKSYLFRDGVFFGQSPLTWFAETRSIGMSPGFEGPFQPSFHRKISTECAFCHVGSIDRKQHNPYKFEILETSIGCERCHGPGELHARRYRDNPAPVDQDLTIVNPGKLSRRLAEAICQQCHLQGANWVTTTDHDMWDFRPSRPITDVRVDYQLTGGSGGMRIVGHVEQLHASECYKQTDTLTCTTCHPPHNPVALKDRVAFYRGVCLDCHYNQSGGKRLGERMQLANNDCYQCHMPKADTNVTHAAFHHHRIGVHTKGDDVGRQFQAQLIPVLDVSVLSERERTRCLSIAKVLQLRDYPSNPDYYHFGHEATEALIKLKNSGAVDAMCDAQLALLAVAQNQVGIARGLATQTLAKEPRPTIARIEATELLARLAYQDGQMAHAVQYYRQLTRDRRDAHDHLLLGLCEKNLDNLPAAIAALQSSLEIDPLLIGPHAGLQEIYEGGDQADKASLHEKAEHRVVEYNRRVQTLARRASEEH
jgi:hypothetical protein